jgi:GT2 family glycosyltransferase
VNQVAPIPVIVVLYHREEDTRRMFNQLSRVTDSYSLIIVNNGFDDIEFIRKLGPLHYVENKENTGVIQGINQGLELAEGKYVAVLHNDILIYDDGWLDHIIEFMERRPDVGLVALQGAHTTKEDGRFDFETNVVPNTGWCPESLRPTWQFSEVAMIDGVGWVMRNVGIDLEEGYGMMHCYDLDLALRFIDAGHRVYVRVTVFNHLIQPIRENVDQSRSTRGREDYLERIGGDDDRYFDLVTDRFKAIWHNELPITRGFRDEAYGYLRADELRKENEFISTHIRTVLDEIDRLSTSISFGRLETSKAVLYTNKLRRERDRLRLEIERMRSQSDPQPGLDRS